jgi:hypothetical protein
MSDDKQGWARRYHWYCEDLVSFVEDPHKAVVSEKTFLTLNLVDRKSKKLRDLVVQLSSRDVERNMRDIFCLKREKHRLPRRHQVLIDDINPLYLDKILLKTYDRKPPDFEALLSMEGVGAKTLRALALISDLIYGESVSFRDPARFSYAHGGKDGYPYRISIADYDRTVAVLTKAVKKAKMEYTARLKALRRLHKFYNL